MREPDQSECSEIRDNNQGVADLSPDHDSSPKLSTTSRDFSPTRNFKIKPHDMLSVKKRRKKPRNIYVTPQKQRLLRLKQKEREENKKKLGLADAMVDDNIHYGSASLGSINNAFEEDFGRLLRGEAVETPANPLDVAVDLLLGTALGGIALDNVKTEGEANIDKIDIDPYKEGGGADEGLRVEEDLSPVPTSLLSANESSLDAPIADGKEVKGGSPSCQLLAEAENDSEKHDYASELETADEKHDHAGELGAADIDSTLEVQKIMPLMKESVVRVPSRNFFQQINVEEAERSQRSVSILSAGSHESQSRSQSRPKSPELESSGVEVLEDQEAYLSRPLERRLSFGPDYELQEHIAKGLADVPTCNENENEDMVMVDSPSPIHFYLSYVV